MIRLNNVQLVDARCNERADVLIEGERIVRIGSDRVDAYLKDKKPRMVIEGDGLYLSPSFIDLHFHLRNPGQSHKQTYEEASRACLRGGYTAVVAMANTNPICDCAEILQEVERDTAHLPLQVLQCGAVSVGLKGTENVAYETLLPYTRIFSDDGRNVDHPEIMKQALLASKELGFIVMDHDEPETENVVRNIALARETGGRLHFCHISKKESIEAIAAAKREGLSVTFEVTPHHIYAYDNPYRVNPPIGTKADQAAILDAVRAGIVDAIATDHAPHTQEEKQKGAPGIANIETAFGMVRYIFEQNGIDLQTQIALMSNRPAALLGMEHGLYEGARADLVLYDDAMCTIDKTRFATRSKNTPFDGEPIRGAMHYTIVGGVLYDHGQH